MLNQTRTTSYVRRTQHDILTARTDLSHLMKTSRFRILLTLRDKVIEAHLDHQHHPDDIAEVMGLSRSQVRRWCSNVDGWKPRGRPPYISPHALEKLFHDTISERANEFEPMTTADVVKEVSPVLHEMLETH